MGKQEKILCQIVKKVGLTNLAAIYLLSLFLFMLPSILYPLEPGKEINQYISDSWGLPSGLPQNTVHAIIQTGDGYLWLGTQEGLARFDGIRFKIYDQKSCPNLRSNWIRTLLEDRGGNLWIGTNGGGLSCLNNGKLTTYSQKGDNSSSSKGFANDMVWALCEDHRHRLWIGTDEGLSCMEPGKFTTFTTKDGLTNNRIRALHEDRSGHLWIATEGGGLNRMINGKFIPFTGIETANGL
ncbi:MAG: hypothetical protein GY757_24300, partial [bacterium]|nr:hypothetical protein [bacterium]